MSFENEYKQFVEESGSGGNDETMNESEMLDLQMAIKNSKETVRTDEEWEEFAHQDEENHKFSNDAPSQKATKEKSSAPKQSTKKQSSVSAANTSKSAEKKFEYTFHDMPESSGKTLEIVYHKPVYDLPIPTNPKYKKLSVEERVQLLNNYFSKLANAQASLAKQSLYRAPYSKPILPSSKCKTSLLKDEDEGDFFDDPSGQTSTQDVYVSRAGRQVKRKIYVEDIDNDNDSDSDFASVVKKNKTAINPDTKITIDTPCVVEEKHNGNNAKPAKGKKLPAKRPTLSKKMSRADELFENLIHENENTNKKQQEMANFEKTLPKIDEEDENMLTDGSPTKDSTSGESQGLSVKNKASSNKTASKEDSDNEDIVPASQPDNPILQDYINRTSSAELERNPQMSTSVDNSLSEDNYEDTKRDCPLCGKAFPQSEIENHAANCENFENEVENTSSTSTKDRNDTPRPAKARNPLRSREMFPALGREKQMIQKQEMADLSVLMEEEKMIVDDSPTKENCNENNEKDFVKRRVVPPKPSFRKGPKSKKQQPEEEIKVLTTPPGSPVLRRYDSVTRNNIKSTQKPTQSKENLQEVNREVNKTDCPICGKKFPQNEIEDHAATCENFEAEELPKTNKIRSDQITCELCDQVFMKNTEYEVHVKQCIAGTITKM